MSLPAIIPEDRPEWWRDAACRNHPDLSWFPAAGDRAKTQIAICQDCPVKVECGIAGRREVVGIWGGRRRDRDTVAGTNSGSTPRPGTLAERVINAIDDGEWHDRHDVITRVVIDTAKPGEQISQVVSRQLMLGRIDQATMHDGITMIRVAR